MKAAVYYETGPPDVFRYEDVPDPVVYPGGVIVAIEAISIEGGDTLNRAGGEMTSTPHIVGYQCAGTIREVGEGVTDRSVGQRVVCTNLSGSHAELMAVPTILTWPVPDGADLIPVACVPVAFGTAHDCLFEFGHLQKGETVLVQAGAGGVGIAAIQLAKRAGATVLATASSADRLLTGSVASLAYRGRCITVGSAGRDPQPFDVGMLGMNNQSLTGVFLGAEIVTDRAQQMIASLIDDVAAGRLQVLVDSTYPLSEAAAAHAHLESRHAVGRVVLIP